MTEKTCKHQELCKDCKYREPGCICVYPHTCSKIVDGGRSTECCNCVHFKERKRGPFSVERPYGLAPTSRVPGIVARFPGHDPHRITDLYQEGVEFMCAFLNERWAERETDG